MDRQTRVTTPSPLLLTMAAAAVILTIIVIMIIGSRAAYTGEVRLPQASWLLVFAAAVCWVGTIVVAVRDAVLRRLDTLSGELAEYGDRREIDGHGLAARAAGNGHRALHPVD